MNKDAEIRHFPVQRNQPLQAFDEGPRLAERHTKQRFHCQACLDSGITIGHLQVSLASGRRVTACLGFKPDR